MNAYEIKAQFASGKKFTDVKRKIAEAMEYYNNKSLLARNPKKILGLSYSPDDTTMTIILESENELPMPSKALRLFSTYLVYENPLESSYFLGKQVFKTTSHKIPNPAPDTVPAQNEKVITVMPIIPKKIIQDTIAEKIRRLGELINEANLILNDLENLELENNKDDDDSE